MKNTKLLYSFLIQLNSMLQSIYVIFITRRIQMNKLQFIMFFFIFQSLTLQAQRLEVGGKIGFGFTNLRTSSYFDDNAEATERLTRPQASIVAEHAFSERLAVDLSLGDMLEKEEQILRKVTI